MYKQIFILLSLVFMWGCHNSQDSSNSKHELLSKLEDQSSFIEMNIPLFLERVNTIADSTENRDEASRVIFWKLSVKTAFNRFMKNTNSDFAFVDLWVFCNQVNFFFDRGKGVGYFNEKQLQIVKLNQLLCKVIDERAYFALSESDYQNVKNFVDKESQQNVIENILLIRPSVKDAWYDYMNLKEKISELPQADLPVVIGNVNDRINARLARNSNNNQPVGIPGSSSDNILLNEYRRKILTDSISSKIRLFLASKENSTFEVRKASLKLSSELEPLITSLQTRLQLEADRREEFIVHNVSQIIERINSSFWINVNKTIDRIIILVVAVLVLIFSLPFILGVWFGRVYQKRKF